MSHPADHAARTREKAIWQGAAASVVAKGVSALCLLAQVPLAIGYLGADLFGLWMTLTSALALMAFADLGIGAGVQNEAAGHVGRDQISAARATCANGLAVLGLAGVALAAILLAGWAWLPWVRWLGIGDMALAAEARRGLLVLIILFCANLPLTSVGRLAFGVQLGWLANAWFAVINLLAVIGVVAASGLKLGFASFVAAAALPAILGHVCLAAHLFSKLNWRLSDLPRADRTGMTRLLRAGLPFTLPQLSALALNSAPPVLIAAILGTPAVAAWSLCQRLLGLFNVIQQVFLTQLWPAYTEAHARGDYDWLARNYRRSVVASLGLIAIPQLAFVFWGPWAVAVWSHGAVIVGGKLALLFGVYAAVTTASAPPAYLLNSLGHMRGQATYGLFATVVGLASLSWALPAYGLVGAPLALLLAWTVIYLPLVYREAARALKITPA